MASINDYKQLSQREHVLERSDMWLGEKDVKTSNEIIYTNNELVSKKVSYSPGILKLFDEAITNATDNIERYAKTKSQNKTTDINERFGNVCWLYNWKL